MAFFLLPATAYHIAVVIIAALLIARHKKNIQGLLSGAEGKIGEKAKVEE